MLSDAGDLAQFALGNELEDRVQHRAEDRDVEPAGVVGHVQAGALPLPQPVDVAAEGRRRHGEGEPNPGPDLAGAVVDGPVGIPLVQILAVGVGLVGGVEDVHDGRPERTGEDRNDEGPKAKQVDNLVAGAHLELGVGLDVLVGEAKVLFEEGLEEFQVGIGRVQLYRYLYLPLLGRTMSTSPVRGGRRRRRFLWSSMHLLHLLLLPLGLLPTDKGHRAIAALQQNKGHASCRDMPHSVNALLCYEQGLVL